MNILVVGNGFDLAHNIPTSYQNCLDFFTMARKCTEEENYEWCRSELFRDPVRMSPKLSMFRPHQISFLKEILNKNWMTDIEHSIFHKCIQDNLWIDHFLAMQEADKEGHHKWIDFETEMSLVIQATESIIKELCERPTIINNVNAFFFSDQDIKRYPHWVETGKNIVKFLRKNFSPQDIIEHAVPHIVSLLYEDLLKLTTAVEIYIKICTLDSYRSTLHDIRTIGVIDKVVSFNYTNTFCTYMSLDKRRYDNICHIHGKIRAKINNTDSPIVLGTNEYRNKGGPDYDTDWVMFKKSFQRIYKHTDFHYIEWLSNSIKDNPNEAINIYIFGHSLDATDGDILRELIGKENRTTTVFYRNIL